MCEPVQRVVFVRSFHDEEPIDRDDLAYEEANEPEAFVSLKNGLNSHACLPVG